MAQLNEKIELEDLFKRMCNCTLTELSVATGYYESHLSRIRARKNTLTRINKIINLINYLYYEKQKDSSLD